MRHQLRLRRGALALGLLGVFTGAFAAGAYGSHTFTDVPTTAFYHLDAAWAKDRGITTGCSATTFCPLDPVTRGQMATFLHRLVSATRTDIYTCPGTGFLPTEPSTYETTGSLRHSLSGGVYRCRASLPDGVLITRVSYIVMDNSPNSIGLFRLAYQGLEGVGPPSYIAEIPMTSDSPAPATLADTTLTGQRVDNALYSYWLQFSASTPSEDLGIYGAQVEYQYVGTPTP